MYKRRRKILKKCMFCGAENPDSAEICESCGVSFEYYDEEHPLAEEEKETLENNLKLQKGKARPNAENRDGKTHPAIRMRLGGLAAWALISMFLCHIGGSVVLSDKPLLQLVCLIPGAIAVMNALNVNSWETYERQDREENMALILCIISTILGIVLIAVR